MKYPQPVCILGMHRSGTSCLAGALAASGLDLGDSNRQGSAHNARGNHENHAIVIFHETVLKANGGAWNAPPEPVIWQDRHRERALAFVSAWPADRPTGFKDPRTLLHLEHWLALGIPFRLIGIFRHPLACALSLQSRDGLPLEQGLSLWEHYNRKLLAAWQQAPFPLLNFDWAEDRLKQALEHAATRLGLPRPNADFFSTELRHHPGHEPRAETLPETVKELHEALQQAAEQS